MFGLGGITLATPTAEGHSGTVCTPSDSASLFPTRGVELSTVFGLFSRSGTCCMELLLENPNKQYYILQCIYHKQQKKVATLFTADT